MYASWNTSTPLDGTVQVSQGYSLFKYSLTEYSVPFFLTNRWVIQTIWVLAICESLFAYWEYSKAILYFVARQLSAVNDIDSHTSQAYRSLCALARFFSSNVCTSMCVQNMLLLLPLNYSSFVEYSSEHISLYMYNAIDSKLTQLLYAEETFLTFNRNQEFNMDISTESTESFASIVSLDNEKKFHLA